MHNYPLNERPGQVREIGIFLQSFQVRFEDFGDLPLLVVELINDNLWYFVS
jgi:hypothetical protein